jgi:ATP-dependent DNA ligase
VHEIKHDGYRLIARRTDDRVRLYTRRSLILCLSLFLRSDIH